MIKQNPNLLQVTREHSLNVQVFSHYAWIDLSGQVTKDGSVRKHSHMFGIV